MDVLKKIDFSKKTYFIIDSKKNYFLIKCFLLSKNILFFDEFMEDFGFDELYQMYEDNSSDENFLNVLSHPLCEQKDKFVEVEKYMEFPKSSFDHFKITKKILSKTKDDNGVIGVFLLKEPPLESVDQLILTSEWSNS